MKKQTFSDGYVYEFDSAALWCAENDSSGRAGDPLPANMAKGLTEYIQANREVFIECVKGFKAAVSYGE